MQQLGFLLGSCGVRCALTSETCLKGLPKTGTGEVIDFKGWPHLFWITTEHMPKPPKDWKPPARLTDETVAYIEVSLGNAKTITNSSQYTTDADGSVKGVCVPRSAMLAHCRALTAACQYVHSEWKHLHHSYNQLCFQTRSLCACSISNAKLDCGMPYRRFVPYTHPNY
jgi:hypothetical protein